MSLQFTMPRPRNLIVAMTALLCGNLLFWTTKYANLPYRTSDRDMGKWNNLDLRNKYNQISVQKGDAPIEESLELQGDDRPQGKTNARSLNSRFKGPVVFEAELHRLQDETHSLRSSLIHYEASMKGKSYLQDYINDLNNITMKQKSVFTLFDTAKQDERFSKFLHEFHKHSMKLRVSNKKVIPVVPNIANLNISELEDSSKNEDDHAQCIQPKYNVAFLKVHKAGSSTVQNILHRVALRNKLNVALPNRNKTTDAHYHYLNENGRPLTHSDIIPLPMGEEYNMLLNHAIYNRQSWEAIMPKKTFYFAIVREPEDRFVSAAYFYGLVKKLHTLIPNLNTTRYIFTTYLQNPTKYIVNHYFYNAMAYDFGIPASDYDKPKEIFNHAFKLSKDFNLIMLMEYFDHSLVMLKRRLCWETKDILYLQSNQGARASANGYMLSENDKTFLRKWQSADFILYKVFQTVFWNKVLEEGDDFLQEVFHFTNILGYVTSFCANPKQKELVVKKTKWHSQFSVTIDECSKMKSKEFILHDTLVEIARTKLIA